MLTPPCTPIQNLIMLLHVSMFQEIPSRRHLFHRRQLLAASYIWTVSFDVIVSLAQTNYDDSASFALFIETAILDESLEESIESSVGVSVDLQEDSVNVVRLTSSPTFGPTFGDTAAGRDKDSNDHNARTKRATIIFVSCLALAAIFVFTFSYSWCCYKVRSESKPMDTQVDVEKVEVTMDTNDGSASTVLSHLRDKIHNRKNDNVHLDSALQCQANPGQYIFRNTSDLSLQGVSI